MSALPLHDSGPAYDQGLRLAAAGRHFEAIECFERALALSPSDARILFALGRTAQAIGQGALAREFYSRVLALEPGRIEAAVNLANLLRAETRFEAARALLAPILARNAQSPELQLSMGLAWGEDGDAGNAAAHYRAALEIDPGYAPALSNLADILADQGDSEGARKLYDRAIAAAPGNAQARLNRAILHLMLGELSQGWRDYEARREIPGKVPATKLELPDWTGGTLKNIRLLVRSEQGVGDELMFASLFGELILRAAEQKGSVILECDPRLVSVFARSFPGAAVFPAALSRSDGRVSADYGWLKNAGGAGSKVLAGSLPRYMRKALSDFPQNHAYLKPEMGEQVRWHGWMAALGASPAIGICWRSGKTGGHRTLQYAPLGAWAEFLKDLPGTLISAQYDAGAEEIAELERLSGRTIFVPPQLDQKNELDRACAMLSALDILVSAPTAVSWLGAGAGVATLKLLYAKSWTSLGQGHEPLAPACQCVMPDKPGDWQDAFAKAKALIAQL